MGLSGFIFFNFTIYNQIVEDCFVKPNIIILRFIEREELNSKVSKERAFHSCAILSSIFNIILFRLPVKLSFLIQKYMMYKSIEYVLLKPPLGFENLEKGSNCDKYIYATNLPYNFCLTKSPAWIIHAHGGRSKLERNGVCI